MDESTTPPSRDAADDGALFIDDFAVATGDDWRARVDAELGDGADRHPARVDRPVPHAGVDMAPVYGLPGDPITAPDPAAPPDALPYVRGGRPADAPLRGDRSGPWRIAHRYRVDPGDPAALRDVLHADLRQGLQMPWLVVDGPDGLDADDWARALDGVGVGMIGLGLDAGAHTLPVVASLAAALDRRDAQDLSALDGCWGCDPIGTLARAGTLARGIDAHRAALVALARWSIERAPGMRAALVDASIPCEAGAETADELAWAASAGLDVLRTLTKAGLAVDDAADQIAFRLATGEDTFTEIAKCRALRLLWAKLAAGCGVAPGHRRAPLYATLARRGTAARGAHNNLLRMTHGAFVAGVGGADAIDLPVHDARDGGGHARRLARNVQHLLAEEGEIGHVLDPAGGSFAVEALTDALAREAFRRLQTIEADGGLVAALVEGDLQTHYAAAREARQAAVDRRRCQHVGVTAFPDPAPPAGAAPTTDAAEASDAAADADLVARLRAGGNPIEPLIAAAANGTSHAAIVATLRAAAAAA
ncbi:MAG: methylmalonyl-CoA mutase family protein, partial [Acidobacteriota bacterium]